MEPRIMFEERKNSIVFSIYKKISKLHSNKSLYKLLNEIAFNRYETAKLSKDENYKNFGKARFVGAEWGRCGKSSHNIWDKEFMDKMYYPFNHKLNSEYEVLITPIYKKYKFYESKIKELCDNENSTHRKETDYHFYDYKHLTNFVVKDILIKSDSGVFINVHNNIPLTMFYYEKDNILLEYIEKYGNTDFLSSNILIYKSIIHTPPELHEYILSKCVEEIVDFNNKEHSINIANENNIASIFWYLSQATLYERGSASISEILCSALLTNLYRDFDYIIILNGTCGNIMLDIEAMILNKKDFIKYWNDNIHKFIKKVKKNTINNTYERNIKLDDKPNIEDIIGDNNIIEDLKIEFSL